MYLFALLNSDSVKQNRNKYLTQENIWQTVNVNISVKITIYIFIFYNPTPKRTRHSNISAFLHFQSFCMIYKLVSSWDLKNIR